MSVLAQPVIGATEIQKLYEKGLKSNRSERLKKLINSDRVVEVLMKEDYTPIQILIFYYLDLINQIEVSNTKKKILFSIIFKTEGFENIRKHLSNIRALKTIENLQILRDLFEMLGLSKALNKVELDLNKLTRI